MAGGGCGMCFAPHAFSFRRVGPPARARAGIVVGIVAGRAGGRIWMLVPGVVLRALAFGLWFGVVGTAGLFWLVERLVRFLGCQCALSCIGPVVGTRRAGVFFRSHPFGNCWDFLGLSVCVDSS